MGLLSRTQAALRDRAAARFAAWYRVETHAERIAALLAEMPRPLPPRPVFVETGCGLSTLALAAGARELGAACYSCDVNAEKVEALRRSAPEALADVVFLVGDSLASVAGIAERNERVDLAFLDSAPSALHTFREFRALEPRFRDGARVLVDNAALPGARLRLSPCRKGKILVPYLLAHPLWEVRAHPRSGDSMISAVLRDRPDFADPAHEDPAYVDDWRRTFERGLGTSR
jgi:predicted O-methyltransferase YrrM